MNFVDCFTSFIKKKKWSLSQKAQQTYINDVLSHLTLQTDAVAAVKSADLVIEAIVENLDIKKKLFASLDKAASP